MVSRSLVYGEVCHSITASWFVFSSEVIRVLYRSDLTLSYKLAAFIFIAHVI